MLDMISNPILCVTVKGLGFLSIVGLVVIPSPCVAVHSYSLIVVAISPIVVFFVLLNETTCGI